MNVRSHRGAVATWVKVLIGIFVFCALGAAGLAFVGMSLWKTAGVRLADPASAAKLTRELVEIDDPLPEGWHYESGVDFLGIRIVTLRGPDGTIVNITKYLNRMPRKVAEGQASGSKMTIESESVDVIAGQKMPCYIGKGTLRFSPMVEELAFGSGQDGQAITFQVFEPHDKYDPKYVRPLFDHIKSIK